MDSIRLIMALIKSMSHGVGKDGKSAYQYAVDAGYTGTEAEFSARMAAEIPTVDSTLSQTGQAADASVVGNRLSSLSEEIANLPSGVSGLTSAQICALDGMFKTVAYTKDDVSAEYNAFKAAFGITDSDGSGGGNTGDDSGTSGSVVWADGVPYTYELVNNEYVETNGVITEYSGWSRTPYLYCSGATTLRITILKASTSIKANAFYNCWYDADKNFIGTFGFNGIDQDTVGAYFDISVPENAVHFIASHKVGIMSECLEYTPLA